MSGLMHKVKDALSGEKNTPEAAAANKGNNEYGHHHTTTEGGAGTHGSNLTHSGIGQSSTSGDPLHSGKGVKLSHNDMTGQTTDSSGYGTHATGSATAGPHSSSMANKADPRVDSDLDGNRHGTSGSGLTGGHTTGTHGTHGTHGSHGTTGSAYDSKTGNNTGSGLTGSGYGTSGYGSTGSTTAGPHSSNLANKADPRVDSDLDSSRHTGGTTGSGLGGAGAAAAAAGPGHHQGHGYDRTTGGSGLTGTDTAASGYGSSGYGSTTGSSTTAGPHSSNVANKADPRVDSDLDGRRGLGSTTGTSGTTGSGLTGSSTTTGHHGHQGGLTGRADDIVHGGDHHTETANRLDPHVSGARGGLEHATVEGTGSSGLGHSTGTTGGYGSSTGTTAGPHSSNLANKADPRVDSDLDGRRGLEHRTGPAGTSGGYGSSTTGGYGSSTGDYGSSTGGYGSSTGGYGSSSGTTAGPHSSNLANKTDPRVDSDSDGRRGLESTTGSSGTTGGYGSSGQHGHGTSAATSGGYGSSSGIGGTSGGYGSTTSGTHTGSGYNDTTSSTTGGSTTTGPHKSNLMNKLDPRVDSDADGSRMK
ncbi:MAG: hypothetical protein Q9219_001051 [cf. Caloplaca sp. 3 TL-2023]